MPSFSLASRQLGAIIHKNALIRLYGLKSTLIEILTPIAFMFLLVWLKTLSTQYSSPSIAYTCGQTYPWNYASSPSSYPDLLQCNNIPTSCQQQNYYMTELNLGPLGSLFNNYGYLASAWGASYPQYGVQIGDNSTVYTATPLSYSSDTSDGALSPLFSNEATGPSPSFVELMRRISSGNKAAGPNSSKVAIVGADAGDSNLPTEVINLYNYLKNMLDSADSTSTWSSNLVQFSTETELETYVTSDDYDDPSKSTSKISFAIVLNVVDDTLNQYDYTIRSNYTYPWEQRLGDTVSCLGNSFNTLTDLQGKEYDFSSSSCDLPQSTPSTGTSSIFQMPSTDTFDDQISRPQISSYFYGYMYNGFLTLQKVSDEYFMSCAKSENGCDDVAATSGPSVETVVSMGFFPTEPYDANNFQSIISGLLPLFFLLAFLYPFSRFMRGLVLEKEEKIKEGMKIMGLSDTVYGLSWLITLGTQGLITTIGILLVTRSSVFEFSSDASIFLYFFSYYMSVIMFSFLLSTFFSRSKSAAILGTIMFFATYFPFYSVSDPSISTATKLLVSLLSPTAFSLGAGVLGNLEAAGIGATPNSYFTIYDNFSFFYTIFMLVFDSVLYGLLAAYFDKVLPSEYGTSLPWHFPISMWCQSKNSSKDDLAEPLLSNAEAEVTQNVKKEAIDTDLASQIGEHRSLSIHNLKKVFKTTAEDRVAVNNLNLDMFEGQITVLLGHNGAGKSTTISMLTGLINSTSGDAIVRGKSITDAMPEIRTSMGVCPQHDVLFADLTVAQHLRMFAIFKGVPYSGVAAEVTKIIAEVGLTEKANVPSSQLSGGMKRKLSVGIALIGDSKVVILDEPTSGMDPYSRRSTWNILQKNKTGRIILLTTHFMDEADILGDRIGIMAHGQLKCIGSSMFLKSTYGVGYTFTVVRTNGSRETLAAEIDKTVKSFVPAAESLSMVGSEQSYRLPFAASSSFVGLFETLEEQKKALGIGSYGISVTTLEEVFIRVGKGIEDEEDRKRLSSMAEATRKSSITNGPAGVSDMAAGAKTKTLDTLPETPTPSSSAFISARTGRVSEWRVFKTHTNALLHKRMIYGMRDKKSFCFQLVIPTLLVLFGMLLLTIRSNADQPSISLLNSASEFNTKMNTNLRNPIPVYIENADTNTASQEVLSNLNAQSSFTYTSAFDITTQADALPDQFNSCAQPSDGSPLLSLSNYLLNSDDEQLANEQGASRYGAVTFSDETDGSSKFVYNIMLNASAIHGAGIYMNIVNSASLATITNNPSASITTRNHPLPKTLKETNATQTADAFTAALMVMIAFCFLPASYAIFVVKEREVKAKHQQMISGVSIKAYWASTFIWDAVSYIAPFTLTIGLIFAFGIDAYTTGTGATATVLLFALFGPAVASFTYVSSYLFKSHSTAQNIILFQNFVTGVVLMITSFVLGLFESTRLINMQLKCIYRLFPGFCLGDGLIQLTLCNDDKCPVFTSDGYSPLETQGVFGWDVAGGDIAFLAIEIVVYLAIAVGIEYSLSFPQILGCVSNLGVADPGDDDDINADDAAVSREKDRVKRNDADDDVVVLKELRKVYPGKTGKNGKCKVAVKNLSFGIPTGECFGFLGNNGAGKTTTLSILSGEFPPSSGTGYIAGYDIQGDQSLIRRKIGYCPQFDALLELLTVREHLCLYARIKGITEESLPNVVQSIMEKMDLLDFSNKAAGSLSGGNKRKLSVAIAMIGGPSIVFLDEPSTGMDPVARRFMWDVIALMTKEGNCSVILTTHNMEEAEALCGRIGIMVAGRLRCLGSPQELKQDHGSGFEVDIKTESVPATSVVDAFCLLARTSALPVDAFADVPTNIAEMLNLRGTKGGKSAGVSSKIYRDEADAAGILFNLALVRCGIESISSICAALGKPGRISQISETGSGSSLLEMHNVTNSIQLESFLEWWIIEDVFDKLAEFMEGSFDRNKLIERSTLTSCRYQIGGEGLILPEVFKVLEENKAKLGISEYSVGQTTLEQIFNQFAGMSYNPEVGVNAE